MKIKLFIILILSVSIFAEIVETPPRCFDTHRTFLAIPDTVNAIYLPITIDSGGTHLDRYHRVDIISQPQNGTINKEINTHWTNSFISLANVYRITYTPNDGFLGEDSFSYTFKTKYGVSAIGKYRIRVQAPTKKEGLSIILVVNDSIYPYISEKVNRLKTDLANEKYSVIIKQWVKDYELSEISEEKNSELLHTYLKNESNKNNQWITGAILIGNIPRAKSYQFKTSGPYSDVVYWTLGDTIGFCGLNDFDFWTSSDIWVSRIWAQGNKKTREHFYELPQGNEATLINNALDANHEYRTGISRLPHIAASYGSSAFPTWSSKVLEVKDYWPSIIESLQTPKAFRTGLNLFSELSHGVANSYTYMDRTLTHITPPQVNFIGISSCTSGWFGGVANNHLLARHTKNVLNFATTAVSGAGLCSFFPCSDFPNNNKHSLDLLDSKTPVGEVFKRYADYYVPIMTIFYGDLSLSFKMQPHNIMPTLENFSSNILSGTAPLTVEFNANAKDSDGNIKKYEWYTNGWGQGSINPVCTSSTGSYTHTYTLAHRYQPRCLAFDNYNAIDWKNSEIITVAPNPNEVLYVNCGTTNTIPLYAYRNTSNEFADLNLSYQEGKDYTDIDRNIWLHDQDYSAGTWGKTMGAVESLDSSSNSVSGTEIDFVFQSWNKRNRYNDITYKIPYPKGKYLVKLGFAEMQLTQSGKRPLNIDIQGERVISNLDIYKEVGSNTAFWYEHESEVTDSLLEFSIKTTSSTNDAILNCFVIVPNVAANIKSSTILNSEMNLSAFPNPFNPNTTISFNLKKGSRAKLEIYNVSGRKVITLLDKFVNSGNNKIDWNATNMSSGIYMVRLLVKDKVWQKSIILVK